ncbi:hypothetical protein, partial [Klebsiella pneumoniae]|uniref:hypothetical protein n=1 Tax=Klebsiella pneumoniae TaxID=573 RepID=UPI001D0DDA25
MVLVLALAACTDVFLHQPYWVRPDPPQLGYQVLEDKIEIVGNQAFVEVVPGAPAGWLERYEYVYVDDGGNEILPG